LDTTSAEKRFYNVAYSGDRYAKLRPGNKHFAAVLLQEFVDKFDLVAKRCLEVGSGRGVFQDAVEDYTGLDLSEVVEPGYHKPFFKGSAEDLPFDDNEFDAMWSITVLEHIPNPHNALCEMRRVLKNGGLLFLMPAWNCRPWICEGIPVRSYSSLTLRQKWTKLTLPIRECMHLRAFMTLLGRLWRSVTWRKADIQLRFRKLKADYEIFWMADSDACSSIDAFDVIQWFQSRGDLVLSHPSWRSALLSRSPTVVVRIQKQQSEGVVG